jgi:hypothetical protein
MICLCTAVDIAESATSPYSSLPEPAVAWRRARAFFLARLLVGDGTDRPSRFEAAPAQLVEKLRPLSIGRPRIDSSLRVQSRESVKADAQRAKPLHEDLFCARGEMEICVKECEQPAGLPRNRIARVDAAAGLEKDCVFDSASRRTDELANHDCARRYGSRALAIRSGAIFWKF